MKTEAGKVMVNIWKKTEAELIVSVSEYLEMKKTEKPSGEINEKKKEVSQLSHYIYIPHPIL